MSEVEEIDAIAYYKDWAEDVDVAFGDVTEAIGLLANASNNAIQCVEIICKTISGCQDLILALHYRLVAVERELAALKAGAGADAGGFPVCANRLGGIAGGGEDR